MKRILSVALCAVVLVTCCAFSSLAFGGSMTAKLTTDMAEAYTSTHGCHTARFEAKNESQSTRDMYAALQLSTGEAWINYNRTRLSPGSSTSSGTLGDPSETYLCRGVISVAYTTSGCVGNIEVTIIS